MVHRGFADFQPKVGAQRDRRAIECKLLHFMRLQFYSTPNGLEGEQFRA
jgi:hypothetical protein